MANMRIFGAITRGTLLCAMLAAGTALADAPTSASGNAATAQTEPAVWQKHEYSFHFMGFTSTYSCDGLATKLQQMLITAGARSDAKAEPGPCAAPFGRPDKFAQANLTFYTLAPASAAGSSAATPVQGVWKAVAFSNHVPRYLAIGDCELVEQFRSNVLPMFTTRGLDDHTTCIPHQESGSNIDLKFESLTIAATPPAKKS